MNSRYITVFSQKYIAFTDTFVNISLTVNTFINANVLKNVLSVNKMIVKVCQGVLHLSRWLNERLYW